MPAKRRTTPTSVVLIILTKKLYVTNSANLPISKKLLGLNLGYVKLVIHICTKLLIF